MNRRMILYILAKMMGVEGVLLLLPAFVGLLYGEKSGACFLFPATILALIYIIFGIRKPNKTKIYAKEGMIIVASAWILWSMFGAIPFTLEDISRIIWMLFETVSGFYDNRFYNFK